MIRLHGITGSNTLPGPWDGARRSRFAGLRALWLLLPATVLLSGCLGDVMEVFCEMGPDEDHCYQAAAVQEAEPEDCSKIEFPPPRSKCHLMIAENTGDPTVCYNMEDGGMMGYSKEECLAAALRNHSVDACEEAKDEQACRTAYVSHKRNQDCGEGFVYSSEKDGMCFKESEKPAPVAGTDDDIESKVEGDLNTIKDAATGKYMELLEAAIESEEDDAKKLGLEKYKEFLEKSGEQLEEIQANIETLKEIKKIFLDAYDPSMDIDKMSVSKILDHGLFDKIKERLVGSDPPTERSKAEDALSVYEAMLKRQGDIDYLQKGRMDRLKDVVVSKAKDKVTSELKDKVTGIVEGVAGTAFSAVGIIDNALTSFREEAQKEMFVGLAAAYNRQRQSIEQSNPGLSKEEIHARTMANVKANPYEDVPNAGFIKYGNILENKDCNDESNPLCIDNRVFWTAMDKAYQYSNKN